MRGSGLATLVPLPTPDADYRVLVEVLSELTTGTDLPSSFGALARGLARLTHLSWLAVAWRAPDGEQVVLHSSLAGQPGWLARSEPITVTVGLEPWLLPEVPRTIAPGRRPLAAAEPDWPVPPAVTALLTVPLPENAGGSRTEGQRCTRRGALLLGSRSPLDPALVPLLEPCAAHLAVVLEKVGWLERFRDASAQLRGDAPSPSPTTDRRKTPRPASPPRTALPFLAEDPRALEALELVERVAPTNLPVLLDGESGTGKELLARTLHAVSDRPDKPFVAVNVAALTPELVASELFGHAAGSFTGAKGERRGLIEEAEHGTLFLDEIGDMPAAVQPILLRYLEDCMLRRLGENRPRRVEARVVCASHRDLRSDVASGRFRQDLYHRLAGLVIRIPPLRERPQDLPLLARSFLKQESAGRYPDLPDEWWPALRAHDWPGNVRELRNAMRAVAALSRGPVPEARFLPEPLRSQLGHAPQAPSADPFEGWTLAEMEREAIRRALVATGGHKGRAASRLGVSPRALRDRLHRHGLTTL